MDASAKGITFRDLYSDPDAKRIWEESVAKLTPEFITSQSGDTYFSDFRFNLQVPQPPPAIKQQIRTAIDGIQAEIDKLGPEVWAQKYCIDKSTGGQQLPAGWNCFGGSNATITNR